MINFTSRPANLDLSPVKIEAQRRLFALLDKFDGTKTIIWDDALIGPFEFVANASLLKKHEATRLFRLTDIKTAIPTATDYTLFLLRKDYQIAEIVARILQRADRLSLAKTSLVFVPQRCTSIEKLFEHHKLDLDKLNSILELEVEFFLLDNDVISMENGNVFRDLHMREDLSSINLIVKGLCKIEEVYGPIKRIASEGKSAKMVSDLLMKRRKLRPSNSCQPRIHHLILLDRQVDLVTPLLTQLTYEGLLDEIFGIHHGTITLPADKFRPSGDQTDAVKRFELKSSEELYARLRDCHINAVANLLKQSAKNLQVEYEECNSEGKTIHEMGKIVKRLNHLKKAKNSQSNQVAMAELVNEHTLKPEFIYGLRIQHQILQEDKINRVIPDIDIKLLRQEPPLHVIRLICLQSMLNNGLKPKICDYYKRELIQNYGDDYLLFVMQLEQAKLLLNRERFHETGGFSLLKSKFGLINENVDECNPNHPSYVYGGYTPLSVVITKNLSQSSLRRNSTTSSHSTTEDTRTILVFFIGGCTFAEISALRFLSQQEENNTEFIVGTTKIINGDTFLKSLAHDSSSVSVSSKRN